MTVVTGFVSSGDPLDQVALNAMVLTQDVFANRPASDTNYEGKLFYATDTGVLYVQTSAGWEQAGFLSDPAVGVAGARTLGTGALQAAAGNHTHSVASVGKTDSTIVLDNSSGQVLTNGSYTHNKTQARVIGGSGKNAVVFSGSCMVWDTNTVAKTATMRLLVDSVEKTTVTAPSMTATTNDYALLSAIHVEPDLSAASHNFEQEVKKNTTEVLNLMGSGTAHQNINIQEINV